MVLTNQPFSMSKVIPIARAKSSEPRSFEAVQAELRTENERHKAVVEDLMYELAGMPPGRVNVLRGGHPGELRQSKKAAAATLGMSERQLMRLVERYRVDHPDQPQLGVQPDGNKYARWIINTDRVKAVRYNERPD